VLFLGQELWDPSQYARIESNFIARGEVQLLGWGLPQSGAKHIHGLPRIPSKVRNPIPLGYAGFYIVYSWMILTLIL
jgi:hypothetical protein